LSLPALPTTAILEVVVVVIAATTAGLPTDELQGLPLTVKRPLGALITAASVPRVRVSMVALVLAAQPGIAAPRFSMAASTGSPLPVLDGVLVGEAVQPLTAIASAASARFAVTAGFLIRILLLRGACQRVDWACSGNQRSPIQPIRQWRWILEDKTRRNRATLASAVVRSRSMSVLRRVVLRECSARVAHSS